MRGGSIFDFSWLWLDLRSENADDTESLTTIVPSRNMESSTPVNSCDGEEEAILTQIAQRCPAESTVSAIQNASMLSTPPQSSSCFPNMMFLIGSSLYVWLAAWDWYQLRHDSESLDDDSSASAAPRFWSLYMAISAIAASCYVLVAILQVVPCDIRLLYRIKSNAVASSRSGSVPSFAGHGSAWYMGLTFGCGAVLDLVSAVSGTMRDPHCTNLTAWAAAHLYLANAIMLVCFTDSKRAMARETDNTGTSAQSMRAATNRATLAKLTELLGDYLFLVGSMVDVSLSYFSEDEENSDAVWKYVCMGDLVTSVLWLIDSGLYIAADLLAARSDSFDTSPGTEGTSDDTIVETAIVQLDGDDFVTPLLIQPSS